MRMRITSGLSRRSGSRRTVEGGVVRGLQTTIVTSAVNIRFAVSSSKRGEGEAVGDISIISRG